MRRVLPVLLLGACMDLGDAPWRLDAEPPAPPAPVVSAGDAEVGEAGLVEAGPVEATDAGLAPCPHPGGPQETQVVMQGNAFVPDVVEICAGDTVVWSNRDTKEHTVTSGTPQAPDGLFNSGKLYLGDSWSLTFDEVGDFIYFCSTHKKKMRDALVLVR